MSFSSPTRMVTKYAGFRWISSTNAAVGGRGRYRESGGSLIVRALGPVDSELDLHLKHNVFEEIRLAAINLHARAWTANSVRRADSNSPRRSGRLPGFRRRRGA